MVISGSYACLWSWAGEGRASHFTAPGWLTPSHLIHLPVFPAVCCVLPNSFSYCSTPDVHNDKQDVEEWGGSGTVFTVHAAGFNQLLHCNSQHPFQYRIIVLIYFTVFAGFIRQQMNSSWSWCMTLGDFDKSNCNRRANEVRASLKVQVFSCRQRLAHIKSGSRKDKRHWYLGRAKAGPCSLSLQNNYSTTHV